MKARMQDMIRSSLTEYGVIPMTTPTQSQSVAVELSMMRLGSLWIFRERSLTGKQACSELLDGVATFCSLER